MWDVPYFTIQAKNNFFQIDTAHISEYFSLGVCMEGLNTLYQVWHFLNLTAGNKYTGYLLTIASGQSDVGF